MTVLPKYSSDDIFFAKLAEKLAILAFKYSSGSIKLRKPGAETLSSICSKKVWFLRFWASSSAIMRGDFLSVLASFSGALVEKSAAIFSGEGVKSKSESRR